MRAFLLGLSCWLTVFGVAGTTCRGAENRLSYLDEFCDPYYVGRDFPKLTTPQWIGEQDVQAVVVLAIDDMRDTAKYEAYLRPIIERLKQIDGRAPVSIMTCRVDPFDPQLKTWIDEGLSVEVHTVDHPCPLLQGGDFAKAKGTYDRGVDLLNDIPGNRPVAFRMPCCDSLNTPSPRFWMEIFNKTTERGNYLEIDSSVFNITTPLDKELPKSLTVDPDGRERFRKYLPFPSFVNTIEDYPYPYVIGRLCWEFPCVVPSDWEAQNLHQPNNPRTVEDLKAALDVVVLKQGVFNLVFHPHGWIRNDQVVDLIDHAVKKHGHRVKFLTFGEALDRLNNNLLAGEPLRNRQGRDNGVRIVDLDNDGYLDVHISNSRQQLTRTWRAGEGWQDTSHDFGSERAAFGTLQPRAAAARIDRELAVFTAGRWRAAPAFSRDLGRITSGGPVRLRDLNQDGVCELLVADPAGARLFRWQDKERRWVLLPFGLPAQATLLDRDGHDAGLRFVDVNRDGFDDVLFSDGQRYSLHLFDSIESGWTARVIEATRGGDSTGPTIPMIVRPDGTNNGVWFHSGTMWVQNEDTNRMPDLVDRLTFDQMLGK